MVPGILIGIFCFLLRGPLLRGGFDRGALFVTYVAVRRKSLSIGIIVHVLVNSIDAVMGFAFIAQMG
jgi:hypothetical protein